MNDGKKKPKKESREIMERAEMYATKKLEWSILLRLKHVRRYIKSLPIWCFFTNYDRNLAKPKHLAVELDGVIVYSSFKKPPRRHDFEIVYHLCGKIHKEYVIVRPMLWDLIKTCSQWYKLYIYTRREQVSADLIIEGIENGKAIFSKKLYKRDCNIIKDKYTKDVKKIGKDERTTVILECENMNYPNKLPVTTYQGDGQDCGLMSTIVILDALRYCMDVRSILDLDNL